MLLKSIHPLPNPPFPNKKTFQKKEIKPICFEFSIYVYYYKKLSIVFSILFLKDTITRNMGIPVKPVSEDFTSKMYPCRQSQQCLAGLCCRKSRTVFY